MLDRLGVKSISSAIDYLTICEEYDKHGFIKSPRERKGVVASRFKVSVRKVEQALSLLHQKL